MPIWLRRMLVVLITIFTFGLVSPQAILPPVNAPTGSESDVLEQNDENSHEKDRDKSFSNEQKAADVLSLSWDVIASATVEEELQTTFVKYAINLADMQSMRKFGDRINEKIGSQYREEILPNLEDAIYQVSHTMDRETLPYIVFTERPASGNGEKIFHIIDSRNGQDLFRYHVRKEHPPQDGYWFSFHYHLPEDQYQKHHELGRIYWDKNTPPQWMA